jgi:hypothetical protein
LKKPNLEKLRDGKLKGLRIKIYASQLPRRRLNLSIKKRVSKSIALALVGVSVTTPVLNNVNAM